MTSCEFNVTSEPMPQEALQLPPFPLRTPPLPSTEVQATILTDQAPRGESQPPSLHAVCKAILDVPVPASGQQPGDYSCLNNSGKRAAEPSKWARSTDTIMRNKLLKRQYVLAGLLHNNT